MHLDHAVFQDDKEVLSDEYQRPYQYLRKLSESEISLDTYSFVESKGAVNVKAFLDVILRCV